MLPSLKPRFWMDLQVVRKIAEINHWFQQLPTGAIATPLTCLTLWSLWSLCTPISGSFECSPILLEHFLIAKLDSWTCHGVLHMCRKSTRYSEGVPPQHSLVRVGWFLVPPKTCQNVSFLKDFMSLMSLARNGESDIANTEPRAFSLNCVRAVYCGSDFLWMLRGGTAAPLRETIISKT